jgi:hypothetical protein
MRLPRLVVVGVAGLAVVAGITPAATAAVRPTALQVTAGPIRQQVTGKPGGSVPVRFHVYDIGTKAVLITASVTAFAESRDGSMHPANPLPGEAHWLRLPKAAVTLQPGQNAVITGHVVLPRYPLPGDADLAAAFRITLLTAATAGAHKGKGTAAAETIPVAISELIVHVPGKAIRRLNYLLTSGGLSWGGPVTLTATVAEHGTDYALLNGQRIRGGGASIPLPGVLLLAGSTRTMSTSWQPPAFCMPCRLSYGTASADVWSLPGLDLLGGLLVLLALAGIGLYLRRNRRRASARRHGRGKPLATP